MLQFEGETIGEDVVVEELIGHICPLVRVKNEHFGIGGRLVLGGDWIDERRDLVGLEEAVDVDGVENFFSVLVADEVDGVVHYLDLLHLVYLQIE